MRQAAVWLLPSPAGEPLHQGFPAPPLFGRLNQGKLVRGDEQVAGRQPLIPEWQECQHGQQH